MAMRTPTNSHHHHHHELKESGSTSQIENLSTSISQSLTDVRLPQELITEILVRLPVKSLMKSKCVSKPWLSLISNPQFMRSHISRSSREGEYLNHQLLFSSGDPNPVIKLCSLYSALQEPPAHVVYDIEYQDKDPDYPPSIIGIINGLVCFYTKSTDLFLWNPVLRKSKQLPSSNVAHFGSLIYGFGYDESNDDYKVVSMVRLSGSVTEIRVYSRRSDSWRRLEDWKSFVPDYETGKYANGKIYWSVRKPSSPTPVTKIFSLDMLSEEYEELKLPNCEEDGDQRQCKFGVLGGRPYLLYHPYFNSNAKADLWLLDKYGVEESWCKVVSIPSEIDPWKSASIQHVVCILSNGEIVLGDGFSLFLYNSKRKEFRNIGLGIASSLYCQIHVYVESLVLPDGSSL